MERGIAAVFVVFLNEQHSGLDFVNQIIVTAIVIFKDVGEALRVNQHLVRPSGVAFSASVTHRGI